MGDSNDETNFPHRLLLTDAQVPWVCKAFTDGSLANIKVWKTQLCNIVQAGEVIPEIPIHGNVLSNLAMAGADVAKIVAKKIIDKKIDMFNEKYITSKGSGTTLINSEIKDILKVIKYLESIGILSKVTTEKVINQK